MTHGAFFSEMLTFTGHPRSSVMLQRIIDDFSLMFRSGFIAANKD